MNRTIQAGDVTISWSDDSDQEDVLFSAIRAIVDQRLYMKPESLSAVIDAAELIRKTLETREKPQSPVDTGMEGL